MKALSIQQPWAWLIVQGIKPVENRTWSTKVRGRVLIHASKKFDHNGFMWLANNWWRYKLPSAVGDMCDRMKNFKDFETGGIVGSAEITDCVTAHPSPFFSGHYGFVLANAKPLPFRPLRGQLSFFEVPDV